MVMIDSIIFYSVLFLLQAMITERRFGTLFWFFSSLCVGFIGHLITYPLFNRGLDGIPYPDVRFLPIQRQNRVIFVIY
ncbi:hypothetical protein JOD20_005157 [Herpetosiphon giganteus]|nr:hypothetical protein [Herpetosiphon giganteus]